MSKSATKPQLIVFGIDGASFSIMKPLIQQGLLPTFARLLESGVFGDLESVIPPVTAPAWVSFLTGCFPQKHGVFGFETYQEGQGSRNWVSSRTIRVKRIWEYLNAAGLQAGVVNVPVTYPPDELNGYMIAGFLTPPEAVDYSFPFSLKEELQSRIGNYTVSMPVLSVNPKSLSEIKQLVDRLLQMTEIRYRAIMYLLKTRPVDVFICVFMIWDKLQHLFGSYLDPQSPLYHLPEAVSIRTMLEPCYTILDKVLAFLLSKLDANGHLIIVSDHGFGALHRTFYVNNWLEENGFLTLHRNPSVSKSGDGSHSTLFQTDQILGLHMHREDFHTIVAWNKTLAFAGDVFTQGIFVNVKNREPQGIVSLAENYDAVCQDLRQRLLALRDPLTGQKFIKNVYRSHEIYGVQDLQDPPDLIVNIDDYASILSPTYLCEHKTQFIKPNSMPWGFHRSNGIFMGFGPALQRNQHISHLHIADICPLILHLLDLAIPNQLDGHLPADVFTESWLRTHPIHFERISIDGAAHRGFLRNEDDEALRDHLRGLGYLE